MRLRLLRIDHGRIDGEIAMRGIARRLDDEAGEVEIGRQARPLAMIRSCSSAATRAWNSA